MKVVGREVEMVGVPAATIFSLRKKGFLNISDVFSHNSWFSGEKFHEAVPEFKQHMSLEDGIEQVFSSLDKTSAIPKAERGGWEDHLIEAQKKILGIKNPSFV